MATFSENQVRQLYVATALKGADTHLVPSDTLGTIEVFPGTAKGEHMYFEYMSNDGIVRSDLIKVANIKSVKQTPATKMQRKLKEVVITPTSKPEVGKDYAIRVSVRDYIGMSDADMEVKYGSVRATSAMTNNLGQWNAGEKDKFLKALAENLAINLAVEVTPLFQVSVHSTATTSDGTYDANGRLVITPAKIKAAGADKATKLYNSIVDIDSIIISEVEQPWTIGKFSQVPVYFDVTDVPVNDESWATIEKKDSATVINNGKQIADLEWFLKGERGDIYRGMGYPNNFEYKGVANPSTVYDVIDIEYFYAGDAEDIQKSPKVISIALSSGNAATLLGRIKAGAGIA